MQRYLSYCCECESDPGSESTFRFDADPDPIASFTHVGKCDKKLTSIRSNASLHSFMFPVSVMSFGQYIEIV